VQLQARLTGTFLSSDMAVQIVAGTESSGWQTQNTEFPFYRHGRQRLLPERRFIQDGFFNDVTFAITYEAAYIPISHT